MPKPGPKPKPTEVHELEGGSKKTHRPMPENEPKPERPDRPPPAPRYLCKVGKKEWRRISKILHKIGLLTDIDLVSLGAYCVCFATWINALKEIKKHGVLIKAQSGFPMQSPYLQIANKAMIEMRKWLVEFGMTPSSRSRVTVEKKQEVDPMEEFLNSGGKLKAVK